MTARKLSDADKAILAKSLDAVHEVSANIDEHIEFIRKNAGLPPFAGETATPAELLAMVHNSEGEFIEFAEYHVPIYLGCQLIAEFDGHWSIEDNTNMAMFGEPFVDGFGNIKHENVYLRQLRLRDFQDAKVFDRLQSDCQRAYDLRAKFTETFSDLAGTSILRSELERRCLDLDVLPRKGEVMHVWRTRVTKYARLVNIKIKRG